MADPSALNDVPDPTGRQARFLTVMTTIDSEAKAAQLARGAIEGRLAACAQISAPVTSVFRWDNAVETGQEWQVLFKTAEARYDALEAYLLDAHDYDTPEIIATPVTRGGAGYLSWVTKETS
ncbi:MULTISPECIES: divalent-cation tolerance protein CutA [Streptomyces]|uniref:CutA1 divalent ion tolerance protein n=1 Tax=Streptomyces auratus AGR0001 TaxID=1160718 RepID=J1RKF9_9ACTN|nr:MULTISPECIES: divalent-cation tolerance protein CutA [Streptomyces]PJJ01794.1 divalent cation tolerance protein [Streptomyces sp. 2333.5]SEC80720.1 divalent cation tolerance protein [Streptomyces sp. 2314.4]SED66081.1 divalent cation tolerance protein [Streptomyces sp. 2112.2]SOE13898.1 divalent cation tolerance protein [Streptomyces sp. 2323.1]